MQFVARNVAKEELDSTSATVAGNVARKVLPCVRAFTFIIMRSKTHSSRLRKTLKISSRYV